jgi:hypothetical protein
MKDGYDRSGRLGVVGRHAPDRFHPGNRLLAPELIGKLCLGVDPDGTPRWG